MWQLIAGRRTVERELASRPYRTLINLGARYGYYAVGLVRLMPTVKVTAYEGNDEARVQLESAAEANGVRCRVTVAGYCEVSDLAAAGPSRLTTPRASATPRPL